MKKTVINIIYPRISSLLQNPERVKKTEEKKLDLNELLKTRTQKQLAEELGCSQSLISKKINNKY